MLAVAMAIVMLAMGMLLGMLGIILVEEQQQQEGFFHCHQEEVAPCLTIPFLVLEVLLLLLIVVIPLGMPFLEADQVCFPP